MTEEPMTVDAMDRETERLRGEKRGVLAALHACGGRDGDSPGTLLESLDALDRALERLAERRPRAVAALRDPEASERRRERRAVALGRWLETRSFTLGQMRRVEALAGEAGCGLFAEEVLAADGWRRDAHGHWHGPLSPGAAAGPVGDVVVLAQARADAERSLAPSFEQVALGRRPCRARRARRRGAGRAARGYRRRGARGMERRKHRGRVQPRVRGAHAGVRGGPPQRRDAHRRRRARRRPLGGARPAVAAIVLKPLLDQPRKLVELRSAHRRCASVAWRHRKLKHLPHALA